MWYFNIFFRLPVAAVAGKHHYVFFISLFYSPQNRNRINYSSIKHWTTVNIDYRANIRQTARRLSYAQQTFLVMFFFKITSPACDTISSNHLETVRIFHISVIIIRKNFLREQLIKKFLV